MVVCLPAGGPDQKDRCLFDRNHMNSKLASGYPWNSYFVVFCRFLIIGSSYCFQNAPICNIHVLVRVSQSEMFSLISLLWCSQVFPGGRPRARDIWRHGEVFVWEATWVSGGQGSPNARCWRKILQFTIIARKRPIDSKAYSRPLVWLFIWISWKHCLPCDIGHCHIRVTLYRMVQWHRLWVSAGTLQSSVSPVIYSYFSRDLPRSVAKTQKWSNLAESYLPAAWDAGTLAIYR